MDDKKQIAFLVAGMHRSGTSALTRVISLHGISLVNDLMETTEDNPSGYWESETLSNFQESYLRKISLSWDSVLLRPKEWQKGDDFSEAKDWIKAYIQKEFDGSQCFVLKDPRISRLLPLWKSVLKDLDIVLKVIIPYRLTSEVAASLHKRELTNHGHSREGFSRERAHLLWLRYTVDAENDSRQCSRSFVSYDALLNNWMSLRDKIEDDLDFKWPIKTEAATLQIDNFLNPRLNRNKTDSLAEFYPQTYTWIKQTYQALELLEQNPKDQEAQQIFDLVRQELSISDELFDSVIRESQDRVAKSQHVVKLTYQHIHNLEDGFSVERQNYDQKINNLNTSNILVKEQLDELDNELQVLELRKNEYESRIEQLNTGIHGYKNTIRQLKTDISNADLLYNSEYFNSEWYLKKYKDIVGINPIVHYLKHGANEMRDPSLWFQTHYYCENYASVMEDDINPLVHYLCYGQKEGYLPRGNTGFLPTLKIRLIDVLNRPNVYFRKINKRFIVDEKMK